VSDLQFVETGPCQLLCQSVSAIYAFFLAMTLFPEAQKKAQAEIDVVIGTDRLQTYTDRESLLSSKLSSRKSSLACRRPSR